MKPPKVHMLPMKRLNKTFKIFILLQECGAGLGGSVVCLSDWRSGFGLDPCCRQHSFMRFVMKYFLSSFSPFR